MLERKGCAAARRLCRLRAQLRRPAFPSCLLACPSRICCWLVWMCSYPDRLLLLPWFSLLCLLCVRQHARRPASFSRQTSLQCCSFPRWGATRPASHLGLSAPSVVAHGQAQLPHQCVQVTRLPFSLSTASALPRVCVLHSRWHPVPFLPPSPALRWLRRALLVLCLLLSALCPSSALPLPPA